ncbi:hypothetical protein LOK49_Contig55G00005 [Camellia lanceoleosa]|nr:hypothetical protein LOK49_Contig55G00005 [Camellia lanceoleosa]
MTTGEAINRTETHDTVDVKLAYTETKSSTWNASVSLKLGVKTTIETGIPFVADGEVQISAEFTGAYMWGETELSTNLVETVYKVTILPMTRVKESLMATRGSCDVPFSYTQRDTLSNGKQIAYRKDDGLYTGINCYHFKYLDAAKFQRMLLQFTEDLDILFSDAATTREWAYTPS